MGIIAFHGLCVRLVEILSHYGVYPLDIDRIHQEFIAYCRHHDKLFGISWIIVELV